MERGKLWWKERWFSICSIHYIKKEDCKICNTGSWRNVWLWKMGSIIHKLFPSLWLWWVNRPNSKQRKEIEEWFPKLKKK